MREVAAAIAAERQSWRHAARRIALAAGAACFASAVCAREDAASIEPLHPQRFGLSTAWTCQFYDIVIDGCILTVIDRSECSCSPGQTEIDTQRIDLRHAKSARLVPLGSPGEGYPDLMLLNVEPRSDTPPFDPERSNLPVHRESQGCDGRIGPQVDAELLIVHVYDNWATHDLLNAVDAALTVCRSASHSSGGHP